MKEKNERIASALSLSRSLALSLSRSLALSELSRTNLEAHLRRPEVLLVRLVQRGVRNVDLFDFPGYLFGTLDRAEVCCCRWRHFDEEPTATRK